VRLWAVPEGTKPPTRGSFINSESLPTPLVLVARGEAATTRMAVFARSATGVGIRVAWRRGATAALAPMGAALAEEEALHGRAILQQLPSCATVRALAPCAGDRVLDMCAAPGGKTTHLAQLLGNGGDGLVSIDRSLTKVRRIAALCRGHGFIHVRCIAADSRNLCKETATTHDKVEQEIADEEQESAAPNLLANKPWPPEAEKAFQEAVASHGADRFRSGKRIWKAVVTAVGREAVPRLQVEARLRQMSGAVKDGDEVNNVEGKVTFEPGSFDKILLDPPCSAMGQRPLLRWGKSVADIQDHADYQRHFLRSAAQLLRVGGELVYSTCTVTPMENEENVRWALDELPLELLNARGHVLDLSEQKHAECLDGLPNCGLSEEECKLVMRFDPRNWDVGFFVARMRRRCD